MLISWLVRVLKISTTLVLALSFSAAAAENVLILGGAGNSGSAVAKMLIARGDKVTVFVKPTTDRSLLKDVPVEYVVGDAMKADQVDAALAGKSFSVIFETVQLLSLDENQNYARMYANFVPWAKRMGVKQFLGLGSGCGDREAKDCPLSPQLYKLAVDLTKAEHILRDSGVPYTIIRIGSLAPGSMSHPDAFRSTGTSYLTTDLSKFGGVLRADLNLQIFGCIGAERCINKIFVIDDPGAKQQLDYFLCKRKYDTDEIVIAEPRCGDAKRITLQRKNTR